VNTTGDLFTQPDNIRNDALTPATTSTEAAPSTRTTTTAPRDGADDDDDDKDAPAAEPEAAAEPTADDAGSFPPPLPRDHAAEPEGHRCPARIRRPICQASSDQLLDDVYGDWPHHNNGKHLNGGVAEDAAWQRRWRWLVALPTTHYSVPKGKVGRRFIQILAAEFRGVRARTWNSERPLVCVAVVLQTTPGVKRARDIRKRLTHRIDLW
jgi:hypothetical protein